MAQEQLFTFEKDEELVKYFNKFTKDELIEYMILCWLWKHKFLDEIKNKKTNSSNRKTIGESKMINDLILVFMENVESIGGIYNPFMEREFCHHILNSSKIKSLINKLWVTLEEFIKAIVIASAQINYRKWICDWPKFFYQNYVEIFNKISMQKKQQDKKIITRIW